MVTYMTYQSYLQATTPWPKPIFCKGYSVDPRMENVYPPYSWLWGTGLKGDDLNEGYPPNLVLSTCMGQKAYTRVDITRPRDVL